MGLAKRVAGALADNFEEAGEHPTIDGRDMSARDRLVLEHIHLVPVHAKRLARTLPSRVQASDLEGPGYEGLIDAATRFKPHLRVDFEAFAGKRIKGAMIDHMRGEATLPRYRKKFITHVGQIVERLQEQNGWSSVNENMVPQIAQELQKIAEQGGETGLEINNANISWALESIQDGVVSSLGRRMQEVVHSDNTTPEDIYFSTEQRGRLWRAVENAPLTDKERAAFALYYSNEEPTLKSIGARLGFNESRASQLVSSAERKIRIYMEVVDHKPAVPTAPPIRPEPASIPRPITSWDRMQVLRLVYFEQQNEFQAARTLERTPADIRSILTSALQILQNAGVEIRKPGHVIAFLAGEPRDSIQNTPDTRQALAALYV